MHRTSLAKEINQKVEAENRREERTSGRRTEMTIVTRTWTPGKWK